jgi:hypothetical protein
MDTLHTLYHVTRADFLERSRRYSFLVTLGLTIFAAYLYLPPSSANYLTLGLGNYRGIYNSAWVGGAVAVFCSALLSLPAFYLVKNAIERDEQTGVGQIIATTPLSKSLYMLGKAFSNFVFLSVMVGVIALFAGAMQLMRAEVFRVDLWALLSPFAFCVLPSMAMIAALAVLFETIPWLRGTCGNVVYFILWLVLLIFSAANMPSPQRVGDPVNDLWGAQVILSDMIEDTAAAFPDYQGSAAADLHLERHPLDGRDHSWADDLAGHGMGNHPARRALLPPFRPRASKAEADAGCRTDRITSPRRHATHPGACSYPSDAADVGATCVLSWAHYVG